MAKTIHLELFANLKTHMPESADAFPIETGVTIEDILNQLNIPHLKSLLITIDKKRVNKDYSLNGGEHIKIFPPMRGG
jgi:sulfur carrier protein ThiS